MRREPADFSRLKKMSPYQQIWQRGVELQNWSSSAWWFFLLMPEGEDGYGPEQMMFTFASRAGELYAVNRFWQRGMSTEMPDSDSEDRFMTTAVGWICDGEEVHEEIVLQPVEAILRSDGSMVAWEEDEDGNRYGGEIIGESNDEQRLKVFFNGKRGYAKFEVWSDTDWEYSSPAVSGKLLKPWGNFHLVAWKKFHFSGEFKGPMGTFKRKGIGYFQRVCMNIPMFPWFWNYTVFKDGSIFSGFQPYAGLHVFRKGDEFFSPRMERAMLPMIPTSYFADFTTKETTHFTKTKITPLTKRGELPRFEVYSENEEGDFIRAVYSSHGHAQFLLDRRMLNSFFESRFNYNEFMTKVVSISGKVKGRIINKSTVGQGWGNMEYTWGISL